MNLHTDREQFRDAVIATSQHMIISEVLIEKDYWVTYVLKKLSESGFNNQVVFKGGTALSKAYKIIERFSEDVDLTIILPEGIDDDQIEELIISVERGLIGDLKEVVIDGLTIKDKRYRRTIHLYDRIESAGLIDNDYGQATDKIMMEINSYGTTHPHRKMAIQSYIADHLIDKKLHSVIEQFGLQPFPLLVLDINRTMVEKITAIARACFSDNLIDELNKKIRHIYDITLLWQESEVHRFLRSEKFYELLDMVDEEDSNNPFVPDETIGLPFSDAKIFSEPEKLWKSLEPTFKGDFKRLVFGDLPDSDKVIECLSYLHSRLKDYDISSAVN